MQARDEVVLGSISGMPNLGKNFSELVLVWLLRVVPWSELRCFGTHSIVNFV